MQRVLVVYYSLSGVSRTAARRLAEHNGWALTEIADASPRTGVAGITRSVLDSLLLRYPRIRYPGPDPATFHTVVLVSPVWMYRLAGPMRTFVTDYRKSLKRVAVVSTMGSAGAANAASEIAQVLGKDLVRAEAFTAREIQDGSGTARLFAFGHALLRGRRSQARGRQGANAAHA